MTWFILISFLKVVQSLKLLNTANRLPWWTIPKDTVRWKEIGRTIRMFGQLTDDKLQNKFGMWSTNFNVMKSEIQILHFPATNESESSAILTLIFPARIVHEENRWYKSFMRSDALKSIIQVILIVRCLKL